VATSGGSGPSSSTTTSRSAGALTVRSLLERTVARDPHAPAIVTGDERLSYGELLDRVTRTAEDLRRREVGPGHTVAASTADASDAIVSFLATMWLGARWMGVNPTLAAEQRLRLLAHGGASVLVTDLPEVATLDSIRHVLPTTSGDGPSELGSVGPWPVVDPHAPAAIAYTSGTTGEPKGVVHSQHNITLPSRYLATTSDLAPGAVVGVCLPTTSLNVLAVVVLPAFAAGAPCVIVPGTRSDVIAEWVAEERITTMSIPPPAVIDLATRDGIDANAMATLVAPRVGGAPLSDAALEAYEQRFGARVMRTYGLTEAPTIVAVEPRGEVLPAMGGRIVPYLRVSIRDADRTPVPTGTVGEIWIAAAVDGEWADTWTPMLGYLDNPAATAATLVDGWTRTGDLGRLDDDGVLHVVGRASGVINRGGTNVYAADVEAVLRAVPGVLDAAVVGLPDDRLGERVAAAVVLRAGRDGLDADALAASCAVELAQYQVPAVFVAVDDLPRNQMGKVLAAEVRRSLIEALA